MKDASLNSISRKRVADLTKEIIWAGSYLAAQQYCAALGGNISVRVTRDHLLCTRAQADLGLLRSADILLCDLAGHCSRDDVLPTSELCLHRAAYEEREDVGAVIHAHPPTATAFAVAGVPLDTLMLPEMVVLLGPVALVPYATPGTEELAQRLKLFLPAHDALLMENHGALTVGRDVREAAHHMELLEHNARITLMVRQIGKPYALKPEEVEALMGIGRKLKSWEEQRDHTRS